MSNDRVTIRDVYTIVERLENKFDEKFKDHESRIRKNEGFVNRAIGISVGVSSIMGFVGSYLADKIFNR